MWTKQVSMIGVFALVCGFNAVHGGIFDFFRGRNEDTPTTNDITFTQQQLRDAVAFAEEAFDKIKRLEFTISTSNIKVGNDTASYAQLIENLPNSQAKEYDKIAQVVLKASKYLLNNDCTKNGKDVIECAKVIASYPLPETDLLTKCLHVRNGHTDGFNAYRRLLPAQYADNLYKIKNDLPLAKNVSDEFFEQSRPSTDLVNGDAASFDGLLDHERNIALVQWAQFIEHDLARTVFQTMGNDNPIECCTERSTDPSPRHRHPACMPLKVDVADEDFTVLPSCLNYVRSALGVNPDCKFGPAQQLNQASNTLDLSQLYGITEEVTNSLRSFRNGQLLSSNAETNPTLPESQDDSEHYCMINSTIDGVCYKSGDSRVNINPYATTLYTIFLRSHNQIALRIAKGKQAWKDERIFQAARKINTAIYQKIVFNEWANVVLGNVEAALIRMEDFSAKFKKSYRAVSNEFATAGIRFYYSMMPGELKTTKDVQYFVRQNNIVIRPISQTNIVKLQNEFYKPRDLSENNELENLFDAILNQRSMAMDSGYVADVVKHYYRFKNAAQKNIGTDVFALDILRGRDHGLAPYAKYLELCTNNTITDWSDLRPYVNEQDLANLQKIYASVHDVDLIVGAISEKPKSDATVGVTLACIIGEQLSNTRRSDPFFYELSNELRLTVDNYTGAKLICETTKLGSVPRNIFYLPSPTNPLISCATLRTELGQ